MPANSKLLVFCFSVVILILTPGPNFLYILTRGATQGRRAALVAAAGLGAGVLVHTTLAAVGMAALIHSSYLAFQIIKYGGSLYLIYLGLHALRDHPRLVASDGLEIQRDHVIVRQSMVGLRRPASSVLARGPLSQSVADSARGHG